MKQPLVWEPSYRLNTCTECGHYLHEGKCPRKTCECSDGVGRFYGETQKKILPLTDMIKTPLMDLIGIKDIP